MDVMKVYAAGSRERARLVAVKSILEAYTGDDYIIREVDKDKDTYCRSLDSINKDDKWSTIMRRRDKEILYHTCLTPEQQERIVDGDFTTAAEVIKEVIYGKEI